MELILKGKTHPALRPAGRQLSSRVHGLPQSILLCVLLPLCLALWLIVAVPSMLVGSLLVVALKATRRA